VLALEFVQPVVTRPEHDLGQCVTRVVASPTACRRVLEEMTQLVSRGELVGDPKWEPAVNAVGRFADAWYRRPRSQSRFQR
jgi:hypothetical protein